MTDELLELLEDDELDELELEDDVLDDVLLGLDEDDDSVPAICAGRYRWRRKEGSRLIHTGKDYSSSIQNVKQTVMSSAGVVSHRTTNPSPCFTLGANAGSGNQCS